MFGIRGQSCLTCSLLLESYFLDSRKLAAKSVAGARAIPSMLLRRPLSQQDNVFFWRLPDPAPRPLGQTAYVNRPVQLFQSGVFRPAAARHETFDICFAMFDVTLNPRFNLK